MLHIEVINNNGVTTKVVTPFFYWSKLINKIQMFFIFLYKEKQGGLLKWRHELITQEICQKMT